MTSSPPASAFGARYVSNHEINPPKSHKKRVHTHEAKLNPFSTKDPSASSSPLASSTGPSNSKSRKVNEIADKAKRAAKERSEHGGKDHDVNDELEQNRVEGASQGAKKPREEGAGHSASNTQHNEEDPWKDWNPLSGGAKTSTLHFATVLFTIFYPSSVKPSERQRYSELAWIGRPKKRGLAAFMSYLGQYGAIAMPAAPALLFLAGAQIPALAGAPLADPHSNMSRAPPPNSKVEMGHFGSMPPKFPVMVFSHGLAGNRLSYSQFCGELASQGIVVVSMEHRDGSGVASIVRLPLSAPTQDAGKKPANEDEEKSGSSRRRSRDEKKTKPTRRSQVRYFPFEKVGLRSFAEDPDDRETGLRLSQLAMRSAEIREALHVLREIAAGRGEEIAKQSTRSLTGKLAQGKSLSRAAKKKAAQGEAHMLQQWKGKLDVDFPALCGHSFGGATVIELQRKPASETSRSESQGNDKKQEKHGHSDEVRAENESRSPFPYVLVLDPWVDPLLWKSDDGDKSDGDRDSRPVQGPIYVINSETFTVWREHFAKLKRILRDSLESQDAEDDGHRHGWLMTLAGCQHLDFSDLPLILPHVFRSTVGPRKTISIFTKAAYTQMGLVRQRHRDLEDLPGAKSKDVWPEDEAKEERKRRIRKEVADDLQRGTRSAISTKIDRADSPQHKAGDDGAPPESTDHAEGSSTHVSDDNEEENVKAAEESESFNDNPHFASVDASQAANSTSQTWAEKRNVIKKEKDAATDRFWRAQRDRKERERRRQILRQRQERGLHATIAERTPDGDLRGIPADKKTYASREEEEAALAAIDFSNTAEDVSGDPDAKEVHAGLSDLVANLDYKKVKIHSLMAFLFRAKGLHPGIDQPGRVLIHDI